MASDYFLIGERSGRDTADQIYYQNGRQPFFLIFDFEHPPRTLGVEDAKALAILGHFRSLRGPRSYLEALPT